MKNEKVKTRILNMCFLYLNKCYPSVAFQESPCSAVGGFGRWLKHRARVSAEAPGTRDWPWGVGGLLAAFSCFRPQLPQTGYYLLVGMMTSANAVLCRFLDTSKQAIGMLFIHFANVYLADLTEEDPCSL